MQLPHLAPGKRDPEFRILSANIGRKPRDQAQLGSRIRQIGHPRAAVFGQVAAIKRARRREGPEIPRRQAFRPTVKMPGLMKRDLGAQFGPVLRQPAHKPCAHSRVRPVQQIGMSPWLVAGMIGMGPPCPEPPRKGTDQGQPVTRAHPGGGQKGRRHGAIPDDRMMAGRALRHSAAERFGRTQLGRTKWQV